MRLIPVFNHDISSCHQLFGVCGNCKLKIITQLREKSDKRILVNYKELLKCTLTN